MVINIQENISLKKYNTFGIEANARYFAKFKSIEELNDLLKHKNFIGVPTIILGGGSNVLFTKNFDGLVLINEIKGIEIVNEDNNRVHIKSGAGEVWNDLVIFCINNNWGGIENLSLIPGTVGASPMQNIGAYGVEIKDVFHSLTALEKETGQLKIFHKKDCEFGYRESVFKKQLRDKYIIIDVTFELLKNPQLNTSYGAITEVLNQMNIETPTIRDVSAAVCQIRTSKLPNPKDIGNAGSFFKNPEISEEQYFELQKLFENIPSYPTKNGFVKVPAGWLNEQCGWKGKRLGNYGVHKNQALVLVNYGNADGYDIYLLSEAIKKSVKEKFNITLETEVNIL
ncbi:MAG: UDP-N-acetylmuramate dehydrogenase [Cytophagales bacterium]|nr:MAG: UDP-N-acetylmuramate dehydrogenase [Cytophagales bacterium]